MQDHLFRMFFDHYRLHIVLKPYCIGEVNASQILTNTFKQRKLSTTKISNSCQCLLIMLNRLQMSMIENMTEPQKLGDYKSKLSRVKKLE